MFLRSIGGSPPKPYLRSPCNRDDLAARQEVTLALWNARCTPSHFAARWSAASAVARACRSQCRSGVQCEAGGGSSWASPPRDQRSIGILRAQPSLHCQSNRLRRQGIAWAAQLEQSGFGGGRVTCEGERGYSLAIAVHAIEVSRSAVDFIRVSTDTVMHGGAFTIK